MKLKLFATLLLALFAATSFAQVALTGCTEVANVATCNANPSPAQGTLVTVSGVNPSGYNGIGLTVSASSGTSFSYILGVTGLAAGTGGSEIAANPSTSLSNFTIGASIVALPGLNSLFPATDIGAAYKVTSTVWLRTDNLVAPGANLTGNYAGTQWAPDFLANLLNKTTLAGLVQPYFTASFGDVRVASTQNHISVLAGGGINYGRGGHFNTNLAEFRWAKLPGFANSTVIISSSINWTF
jgi:hypothetical protein